ncbi:MAG: T9SS type A sorting domain-containing protein [Candidatus Cloacimonetes bacterium]|nr:T9SS type A sorting domain-containing protein [Candidatus Cloacimonadota bacterium]
MVKEKKYRIYLVNCLIFLLVLIPVILNSTVIPAGNVSGVWDIAGSPYYIDGEITIQASDQLEIQPGVDVIFNAHYKLIIYGRIVANGTAADSISFTPLSSATGWHGMRFINGNLNSLPASEISFCQFKSGSGMGSGADANGGAIYCTNTSNLTIDNSYFGLNYCQWDGGAIYLENGSNVHITNSIFMQNDCGFYGGCLISYSSNPVIDGCTFKNNTSSIFAAGVSAWNNSNPEIYNCCFIDNFAGACTGIYCVNSNIILANLIMFNNTTNYGSGAAIGITNCTTQASNITVADNTSPLSGGAFWVNGGSLELHNSILWNNLPEDIFVLSGTANVYNSCISDGTTGTNVISADPKFVNYAGYDFHLDETSPCIDSGDDSIVPFALPLFDFEGNNRIIDGDLNGTPEIDMGAYEFVPIVPTGFIAGNVSDIDGIPLENAEITAGTYTATTDSNGNYSMEVEAGEYTVNCYLAGYQIPDAVNVTVLAGFTMTVDFILEFDVGNDDIINVSGLTLRGNYPNPFQSHTTISYSLKQATSVSLEIYNLKGQLIELLLDENIKAGDHTHEWNCQNVQAGVYFLKMKAGNEESVKKLILMR